jgi:hypothetical protein
MVSCYKKKEVVAEVFLAFFSKKKDGLYILEVFKIFATSLDFGVSKYFLSLI